jgi:hypothetical protein
MPMMPIVGMVPVMFVPAAVMAAPVVAPVAAMRLPVMMSVVALAMPITMMTIVDRLDRRLNLRLRHIHHRRSRCRTGADKQADAKDSGK